MSDHNRKDNFHALASSHANRGTHDKFDESVAADNTALNELLYDRVNLFNKVILNLFFTFRIFGTAK